MANTKITELTALTQCAATDVLPIVKVSANTTKKVSISDLLRNAPAGTAAAPGIANADDQDTGILFPAANSIGVSTGGTQRLVIDSSGNVGIGTTPSTSLDVSGAISLGSVAIPSAGTARIYSRNTDNNLYLQTGSGDTINFLDGSQNTLASFGDTALVFNTGNTERLRIDSSGRLLLGTTTEGSSSADDLTVATSAETGITIRSGTSSNGNIFFSDGTSGDSEYRGFITYAHNGDSLRFATTNTERMRIDSSGRLLLGTTTEGDINADDLTIANSGNCGMTIRSGASNSGSIFFSDGTSGVAEYQGQILYDHNNNYMRFQTGASERARIDSSGRLLVGTTSNSGANLFVAGGSGQSVGTEVDIARFFASTASSTNSGGLTIGGVWHNTDVNQRIAYLQSEQGNNPGSTARHLALNPGGGNVGIGTKSPDYNLTIGDGSSYVIQNLKAATNEFCEFRFGDTDSVAQGKITYDNGTDSLRFAANASERMRIDSSGSVGIGCTPSSFGTNFNALEIHSPSGTASYLALTNSTTGSNGASNGFNILTSGNDAALLLRENGFMSFSTNDTERMRIASDGKVGIGHSSPQFGLTLAQSSNDTGAIGWEDGGNSKRASIRCNTSGDALQFNTGASDTERMRIGSNGYLYFGNQTNANPAAGGAAGLTIRPTPLISIAADGNSCTNFGRNTNDGAIVNFYQAGALEGSISVSGSTVSYNGGHLTRWSQLASGAARTEILRGSVLSNLDEMCEWGEENNEQLNRMKISDVEGDVNVAGVFQAWDDDDDTYTNDFYCAMTGDFVIRIAQGTTVARGDLLMSAGDGTAKPQDDDIVRSKTIAKVTSTTVSTTYADGSYCVPCVLMAC